MRYSFLATFVLTLHVNNVYVRPKKHKVEFMNDNQVAFHLSSIGSHQNSYHTAMVLQSLILFKQRKKNMSYLPLLLLKPIKKLHRETRL
uniref:Uncharacterized protein n=1 Tax=Helianthus annuus TaxID=4232 RepID=A0A251RM09_HELAN